MTQTIEYVVAVNAGQAKSAIADVEKRFSGLTDGVTAGAKSMAQRLGPAAAAISSVSASLGAAGGQAGKFVAAGGQIVAAFGAGGPVGAAIVAGTVAVDAMSAAWVKATAAQDAALESMFAGVNRQILATREANAALAETRTALTAALRIGESESTTFQRSLEDARKAGAQRVDEAQGRLDKLKATSLDLKKIEEEAKTLDMTFQQARAWRTDLREKEIASAERALKSVQTQAMIAPQVLVVEQKRTEAAEKRAAAEEKYKAAVQSWMTSYEKMYRFRETPEDVIETTTDEISRTMRGRRGVEGGGLGDVMRGGSKTILDADDMRVINAAVEREQRIADTEETFANMRYEQQKAQADRLKAVWVDYGTDVAAAVGEFAASAALGQEDALEKLVGAASRSAGGFVMLEGGKVMATGIAGMLAAPNPLSAGQIAGGAALVAAGAAIQTGGPAAVSALMGKGGASTSTGPTGSTRDPGASPRSSGAASGSGGPLIINVTYGAGGPLPEDVGREIYRATRSNDRRSGR
jgi:hypothetical protein